MFKPTEEQIKGFYDLAVLAKTSDLKTREGGMVVINAIVEFMNKHKEFGNWLMTTTQGFEFMEETMSQVKAELGLSDEHTS